MDIKEIIKESRASIEKPDLYVLLSLVWPTFPRYVLEIGAWKGYSIEVWWQAFKPSISVTIEPDKGFLEFIDERQARGDFDYMRGAMPTLIRGKSQDEDTVKTVKGLFPRGIDFLFIDGDHSYEAVKKDWELYEPMVNKGGFVVFHDIAYHVDKTEEVDVLWDEIKNSYRYIEIINSPNSTGAGVIIK